MMDATTTPSATVRAALADLAAWLKRDRHRIRHVFERRSGGGIRSHADQTPEQDITYNSGGAGIGGACGDSNLLRPKAGLGKDHDELDFALNNESAWRQAGMPKRRPNIGPGRLRQELHLIAGPSGNRGAPRECERASREHNQFHFIAIPYGSRRDCSTQAIPFQDQATEDAVSPDEITDLRKALYACAASCQGANSIAGEMAARILDVPYPLRMEHLVPAARRDGFDPGDLWPWLGRAAIEAYLARKHDIMH